MSCVPLSRFVAYGLTLAAASLTLMPLAHAQTALDAVPLVKSPVDITKMVSLPGNVRPEATAANDRGQVNDGLAMQHMLLQLNRPADREAALDALMEAQHQPGSASFHQWLAADELGQKFGPNPADIAAVSGWLQSQGLQVNNVSKSGLTVDFSGTASQVTAAFKTEIHNLSVNGVKHVANMQPVQVPAALGELVIGVTSLNDFRPHPANKGITSGSIDPDSKALVSRSTAQGASPDLTVSATRQLVVPDDLHTIYNFNPVYAKNITGKGQTVVVIEDTDVYSVNDWDVFRTTFGLSKYTKGSFNQVHPGGCTDPGVVVGADEEAILDAEYSSAAAPDAAIVLASCADTETTFGGLLALDRLIDQKLPPPIVSISYGACEAALGAAGNAAFNQAYQQAESEGVSVFVSSGDEGAASCDADEPYAEFGIAVSGFASTPYNVAVGGTDFGDTYEGTNSQYWKATNNATYGSAKSYIPEIPWNDSCASTLIANLAGYNVPYGTEGFCNSATLKQEYVTTASGSGGPSGCAFGVSLALTEFAPAVSGTCKGYKKPNYQAGVYGNPSDGVRDIPDVSLFAANGIFGHYYVFCYTDAAGGGVPCTGNPDTWSGAGGTSFASPIVAGVQALVNQSTGEPEGNPNYVYYALANHEYRGTGNNSCNSTLGKDIDSSCIFNDVTLGDNDVDCVGPYNCYLPSGEYGVLSVSSKKYEKAYNSNAGWDFATGIGTLNVANLVGNWNSAF